MKCESAQDWLLQCESLQPKSWPRGVVKHLRVCTGCYQFAKGVKRLEKAWRNTPLPEECEPAKVNFLAKLAALETREKPRPKRDRRAKQALNRDKQSLNRRPAWGMRWLGVAAVVFVGIIGVGWLLPGRNTNKKIDNGDINIVAAAEIVDRLVDWNVRLVNAEPKERKQLLEEYEGTFRTDLKRAVLAAEERQFADDLFDAGRKLVAADGPLAEAEAVTAIADKLLSQAAGAREKGNEKETEQCGMRYSRFNTFAVKPMWNRFAQFKPPEKGGVEKDKGGGDKAGPKGNEKSGFDQKKFDMLKQRLPEFSRPDLHKQFETWGKKGGPPGPVIAPVGPIGTKGGTKH